jgi:hypothetical protein
MWGQTLSAAMRQRRPMRTPPSSPRASIAWIVSRPTDSSSATYAVDSIADLARTG